MRERRRLTCGQASSCWPVTGWGGIPRCDGSAWTNQNSGTKVGLLAVWGSSRAGFFAFGEAGTILRCTP